MKNSETAYRLKTKLKKILGLSLLFRLSLYLPLPNITWNFTLHGHFTNIKPNFVKYFMGNFLGIGSLGLLPYINSLFFIQVLTFISPTIKHLLKDEGELGRQKLKRWTRYLTFTWALFLSIIITFFDIKPLVFNWSYLIFLKIVFALTVGSLISMWFVELITLEDFGNGASIFIFINVIGSISESASEFCSSFMYFSYLNTLNFFVKKVLIHWCSVFCIVLLQTVYKKISIISVKELNLITSVGKQIQKNTLKSSYIPLKLTQGEGMPLVFSSLIISFFHYLIWVTLNPIVKNNSWFTLSSFFLISMSIIIFFNTFYSLLVLKPNDIAENITKMTYSIPGIREGNQSIQYLKQSIFRLAFLGGTFLLLPVFLSNFFSKKFQFNFLSNVNSLLFLIGLIIEITLQLKGYLISEKYEEFKNF